MKSFQIKFIASVNDDSINEIKTIAKKLKILGCRIDSVLTLSGVITGSTSTNISLEDLKIDGIKYIEIDRNVNAVIK